MKIYSVGGAVRDELLGLPVQGPRLRRRRRHARGDGAPGYKPVGKDFPVFLHPQTHEEYALARTERKTGRGYKGFTFHAAPDVTLEDDLARRDLTINAIAKDEDGTLIDPFGGGQDLRARVLRHVSEAFAEDPVRILRVARFAARFGFRVSRRDAGADARDGATPARPTTWCPSGSGRSSPRAWWRRTRERMFEVLAALRLAASRLLPELEAPAEARRRLRCAVRFALLTWPLEEDEVERCASGCARRTRCASWRCSPCRNRKALRSCGPRKSCSSCSRRPTPSAGRSASPSCCEVARLADAGIDTARIERALRAAAAVDAGAIAAKARFAGGDRRSWSTRPG